MSHGTDRFIFYNQRSVSYKSRDGEIVARPNQCDDPELAAGTGARRVGRALSLSTAAGGRAL